MKEVNHTNVIFMLHESMKYKSYLNVRFKYKFCILLKLENQSMKIAFINKSFIEDLLKIWLYNEVVSTLFILSNSVPSRKACFLHG